MGALERSIEPFGIAGHEQISGIVLEKQDGHVVRCQGARVREAVRVMTTASSSYSECKYIIRHCTRPSEEDDTLPRAPRLHWRTTNNPAESMPLAFTAATTTNVNAKQSGPVQTLEPVSVM